MNHLQVISGLLQLNKPERALEYINEAAEELKKASVISRISSAEIAMAILRANLAAHRRGVSINCSISSNLDRTFQASWALAEIIGELLEIAVDEVAVSACNSGAVDLNIYNKDGECVFRVSFPCLNSLDGLSFASRVVFIEETTAKINGRVNFSNSGDGAAIIMLSVPAGIMEDKPESAQQVNI
jgi:hypothetical protein